MQEAVADFSPVASKSSKFTLAAASDEWGEAESWSKGSNRGGIGVIKGKRCSGLLEVGDKEEKKSARMTGLELGWLNSEVVRTEDSARGASWGLGGRRRDGLAFDSLTLRSL